MGFESYFKIYLVCFKICGLDSQALSSQTESIMFYQLFWNYCLITIVIGSTAAIYCLSSAIFSDIDPIGKLTDIVQVMTPLLTYFVVLLEAIHRKREQQKLLLKMVELDNCLQVLGVRLDASWQKLKRNFTIKFVMINTICLSFELLIIGSFFGRNAWAYDWLVKLPTFVLNRMSDWR